jgi:hypothetical protein
MLLYPAEFPCFSIADPANTFGEWNKWEDGWKKVAEKKEEPSETMGVP